MNWWKKQIEQQQYMSLIMSERLQFEFDKLKGKIPHSKSTIGCKEYRSFCWEEENISSTSTTISNSTIAHEAPESVVYLKIKSFVNG